MKATMMPKLCSLIFVIDEQSSRVLLGWKKRGFGEGKLNGYGGKLEAGESMRSCCARELQEECGLCVPESAFRRRGVLNFDMLSDGMKTDDGIASRIEVHAYSCAFSDASGIIAETAEMVPEWFPLSAPPLERMWADDQYWLPHVLAGLDVLGRFVFRDASTILSHNLDVLPACFLQRAEERTRRLRVDHLVFGVPGRLEEACATFEALTGVAPVLGGVHEGLGTRNALVALGSPDGGSTDGRFGYLELIAIDEGQPAPARLWMAMDSVRESRRARLVTWATDCADTCTLRARAAAAAECGYDAGEVRQFKRTTPSGAQLAWTLAYRHYEESTLPSAGLVPFLIAWEPQCREHAPAATAPRGIELLALSAEAVDSGDGGVAASAAAQLEAIGLDPADLLADAPAAPAALHNAATACRLVATLRTPKGILRLGALDDGMNGLGSSSMQP